MEKAGAVLAIKNSEPFGQRAVRMGFVTSEQVRLALERQDMLAKRSGHLGEILVEKGWIDAVEYLQIAQAVSGDGGLQAGHVATHDTFMRMALERAYVSRRRIEAAQEKEAGQRSHNNLIGAILVDMGFITADKRDAILATY